MFWMYQQPVGTNVTTRLDDIIIQLHNPTHRNAINLDFNLTFDFTLRHYSICTLSSLGTAKATGLGYLELFEVFIWTGLCGFSESLHFTFFWKPSPFPDPLDASIFVARRIKWALRPRFNMGLVYTLQSYAVDI